jgi:hypothetical protein
LAEPWGRIPIEGWLQLFQVQTIPAKTALEIAAIYPLPLIYSQPFPLPKEYLSVYLYCLHPLGASFSSIAVVTRAQQNVIERTIKRR